MHDIVPLRQARLYAIAALRYLHLHTVLNYHIKIDNVVIKIIEPNERSSTL